MEKISEEIGREIMIKELPCETQWIIVAHDTRTDMLLVRRHDTNSVIQWIKRYKIDRYVDQ